jgi:uncharacterized membrane protein
MTIVGVILMYAICCLPLIAIFSMLPYISRKNISFGISIPEDVWKLPELKSIRKNYLIAGLVTSVFILIAAVLSSLLIDLPEYLFSIPEIILIMVGYGILYLSAYKKMKKLKSESQWKNQSREVIVVDTSFRKGKHRVPAFWLLLYPAVIILSIMLGMVFYEQAPDKIPMNFDFSGHVHEYANKSVRIIFLAPVIQLFLSIIFIFSYWMIVRSKQQVDTANPEKSAEQNRRFRYRWSAFILFSGFGMLLLFMLMQLSNLGLIKNLKIVAIVPFVFSVLMVTAIIVIAATTGQSGNRIHVHTDKNGNKIQIARDDDKYWKLGFFYFNPEDPSLFIEKRFGIGQTVNWGRPMSWVIMIGLFAFIAVFMVITIRMPQ